MSMKKVIVLLSTYNGEKYLKEQIESILDQSYENVKLFIRDDGSTDRTKDILLSYEGRDCIEVLYGENIGVKESFLELMWKAEKADYYAFSDQDDVWLKDKISDGVSALEQSENKMALYCTDTINVNEELKEIGMKKKIRAHPSFGNALIENVTQGCTMIFSSVLLNYIRIHKRPFNIYMHDWFVYMVASAFGIVFIGERSQILYRQHSQNVVGIAPNRWKRLKRRVKNMNNLKHYVPAQIEEFSKIYPISYEQKKLVEEIINKSLQSRLRLLLDKRIYRQIRIETILYKGLMLLW